MESMRSHTQHLLGQSFWFAIGILALCPLTVSAHNLVEPQSSSSGQSSSITSTIEPIFLTHRTGSFAFTVPNDGTIGSGLIGRFTDDITGVVIPSFESPQNSNIEYLFAGALWVGAIAGDDTLVAVAADGWADGCANMTPSLDYPGVRVISGVGGENFETQYSDSVLLIGHCGNSAYTPGLNIRQRSLVWSQEPNNDFVIIEYHITSINPDTLRELYVGLYLDADVGHLSSMSRHSDDITGFLPEDGIAYIADNDGQSSFNPDTLWTERSARAVIGAKILDIKHSGIGDLNSPSFNWWLSNGTPEKDFGPRMAGTESDPFRDFGGFLGTPEGRANKYYILSHPEQDYDQIETALDHAPAGWLPPPDNGLAVNFANGFDARFLISQGGISLAPGDSMVFVVAIAIGDNLHVNPTDFADFFDPLNPSAFHDKLDFTDLKANIAAAEALYASGYNTQVVAAPPKPTLDDKNSEEPLMSWLFSANPSVEGYDIYLAKAPDSAVLCQYALIDTPLFVPENIIATVATDTFRLTGLEDGAWYSVAVSVHPLPDSSAPISEKIVFQYGVPHAPTWDSAMFLNEDQLKFQYVNSGVALSLSGNTLESDIDHFNLYRLNDSLRGYFVINQKLRPLPGTDTCRTYPDGPLDVVCSGVNRDSVLFCLTTLTPYAQVAQQSISIANNFGAPTKHTYGITAVDSVGNESALSTFILGYTNASAKKQLLFLLHDSVSIRGNRSPKLKEMYEFYRNLLAPHTPDFLTRKPVRREPRDWPPTYETSAQYDMVIVDGSATSPLIRGSWKTPFGAYEPTNWIVDYTRSGGTLVDLGINFEISINSSTPPELVHTDYLPPDTVRFDLGGKLFGLDSAIMIPFPKGDSALDSVNQFYRPAGAAALAGNGFPDLTYHHSGLYVTPEELTKGPIPFKGVIFPIAENTEVLYTWVGGRDTVSDFEGLPIGVKYTPETHTAYVLISSPWEWELEQAQAFFARILGDFQTDVTDEEQESTLPKTFALGQNFPNPFNPTTQISYSVPRRSEVSLVVYNILGQRVRILVDDVKEAGEHVVTWDAGEFASGMYFYRLNAGETKISRKMVLLK